MSFASYLIQSAWNDTTGDNNSINDDNNNNNSNNVVTKLKKETTKTAAAAAATTGGEAEGNRASSSSQHQHNNHQELQQQTQQEDDNNNVDVDEFFDANEKSSSPPPAASSTGDSASSDTSSTFEDAATTNEEDNQQQQQQEQQHCRSHSAVQTTSQSNNNEKEEEVSSSQHFLRRAKKADLVRHHKDNSALENMWSIPPYKEFRVRGSQYLKDRIKVQSESYLLPNCLGVELFMTPHDDDKCNDVAGNSRYVKQLLNGRLLQDQQDQQQLPVLIMNFQLSWGILLFYFEIPEKFRPYLRLGKQKQQQQKQKQQQTIKEQQQQQQQDEEELLLRRRLDDDNNDTTTTTTMTAGERVLCRFLMAENHEYRNQRLKIIPNIVWGPWVVQSVVGNTPAIIGNKLPVKYRYNNDHDHDHDNCRSNDLSSSSTTTTTKEAEKVAAKIVDYLEIDMEITNSVIARSILSLVKTYTTTLVIDLGFVIQGNQNDELPEQMMAAARFHRLDVSNAPTLL